MGKCWSSLREIWKDLILCCGCGNPVIIGPGNHGTMTQGGFIPNNDSDFVRQGIIPPAPVPPVPSAPPVSGPTRQEIVDAPPGSITDPPPGGTAMPEVMTGQGITVDPPPYTTQPNTPQGGGSPDQGSTPKPPTPEGIELQDMSPRPRPEWEVTDAGRGAF
ncbi:hypothetical protein GQ43DRAFT_230559 [Delitschia confertaspora ATCC 74209]|uniref:Uncharacterized protein n=1 Tax=Delitschia confertaspora ATCC 74209 TaxID=1513339 RepID=A0A9P4MUC3_9PLEO|nr:hypothetical protein GQ43DRAFT_230559 [Delitschia confertaspora ATCC 74209]